jgi:hypothetical protein
LPEEFTQLSSKTKCKVLGWGKESELGNNYLSKTYIK